MASNTHHGDVRRRRRAASTTIALVAILTTSLLSVMAAPAHARGGPTKPSVGASLSAVLLDSTDGNAHYGQRVTFTFTTSATKPFVKLDCYQGGEWVYWASAGFFADYPWPWNQNFELRSSYWSGGAADCTAQLYTNGKNGRINVLASTTFHVEP